MWLFDLVSPVFPDFTDLHPPRAPPIRYGDHLPGWTVLPLWLRGAPSLPL